MRLIDGMANNFYELLVGGRMNRFHPGNVYELSSSRKEFSKPLGSRRQEEQRGACIMMSCFHSAYKPMTTLDEK